MILLYLAFLTVACATFAILWFAAPSIPVFAKALIAVGIFLLLSALATAWIDWAAQRMPDNARVITPLDKKQ